jgi:group I intron endonuclease
VKFFVYKITNLLNGKIYIGKTNNIEKRFNEHINNAKAERQGCTKLYKSIRKYGEENFSYPEILAAFEKEQEAYDAEIKFIAKYNSVKKGLNILAGGSGAGSGFNNPQFGNHLPRESQRKVLRPSKEELLKLLWKKPTTQIAKEIGVSDKAIDKWAKSYGISKPPRGFWTSKTEASTSAFPRGERNANSKLTATDILNIRAMYSSRKYGYRKLGTLFNVHRIVIRDIIKKRIWKHLK